MPQFTDAAAGLEGLSPETLLVHGGTLRSGFGELSEAVFVTQSYVYRSAEEAEERFKSEAGFIYSRYANPTVAMFDDPNSDLRIWKTSSSFSSSPSGRPDEARSLLLK